MGREAMCACDWNGSVAQVKALLEPPELILRGELRRRLRFDSLREVRADGDALRFAWQDEPVSLALGSAMAAKWVQAILKPPPSLAAKLGITAATRVRVIGEVDDAALRKALAEGADAGSRDADLIVALVNTRADLANTLRSAAAQLARGVPIWLVYRKGPGHPINENDVRSAGLAAGVVDSKVASVSPALTGLRFVKRRTK